MTGSTTIQRAENGAIAVAILLSTFAFGQPWWLLFAAFLLFDLSAVGYLRSPRFGALTYNLIHNFSGPAIAVALFFVLRIVDVSAVWLALLSAAWAFHVAVDRALGYGLKLESFSHTHLGRIGRRQRIEIDGRKRPRDGPA